MDVAPAGGDLADGGDELRVRGLLQQVAVRAGAERLADVARVVLHREHEDPRLRRSLQDLRRCVEPAPARHDDVEEHDIRLVEARLAHGFLGVAGLVLDADVLLGLEQQTQAGADERVVVDDQDTDHGSGTSATNVVPAPGRDSIVSRPPSSATRSCMPTRPIPVSLGLFGSNPTPSSSMNSDTESSVLARTIRTFAACACFTTFVSDSCTIR